MKEFLKNSKQEGEGLELLTSLEENTATLIFFDPQYEKADNSLWAKGWPVQSQTEFQIISILKEINRVLKPSSFCLLWVNKSILFSDRIPVWLLRTQKLKVIDFLVWDKDFLGTGFYFRSKAEYAFLLQKKPIDKRKFLSRDFPSIWKELKLFPSQKKHPFQKPKELIKALIRATTNEGDLVVDPCAGSFIVLDACQELKREFLGVDLTCNEVLKYNKKIKQHPSSGRSKAGLGQLVKNEKKQFQKTH